jgi:hypothetical protein
MFVSNLIWPTLLIIEKFLGKSIKKLQKRMVSATIKKLALQNNNSLEKKFEWACLSANLNKLIIKGKVTGVAQKPELRSQNLEGYL